MVTRSVTDPDLIIRKNKLGKSVEDYSELSTAISHIITEEIDHARIGNYLTENHSPELLCGQLLEKLGAGGKPCQVAEPRN